MEEMGVYRVNHEGKNILVRCRDSVSVADFSVSGITGIDEGAFDECSSLTVVKLPESLEKIPENLFFYNLSLCVVIAYAKNPPAQELGVSENCAVFVKPESLSAYQEAWGGQVRRILGTSEDYTALTSGIVFDSESTRLLDIPVNITSFQLPSYVTSIAEDAAAGNSALKQITVSATSKLQSIGANAFSGCTSLSAMAVPASVTEVGENAFSGCTKLRTVNWGTSAAVPESCFEGCSKLTTFSASGAGHNLTAIGRRAFYGCQALQTVLYYSYSSGGKNYYCYYFLTEIGEEAFCGCTSMTYAYLNASVIAVGDRAFMGSGLTQLFWYANCSVPKSCFENGKNLEKLEWGKGAVEEVGERAFYGCEKLRSTALPSSVKRIGPMAFDSPEEAKEGDG